MFCIRDRVICTVVRLFTLKERKKRKVRFYSLGANGARFKILIKKKKEGQVLLAGCKWGEVLLLQNMFWWEKFVQIMLLIVFICMQIIRKFIICTILAWLYL